MTLIEAIEALRRGKRVRYCGAEVRLANERLQLAPNWHDMIISTAAMDGYTEFSEVVLCEITIEQGHMLFEMPFAYACEHQGSYLRAHRAIEFHFFRGYKFDDGHIGATLWCVKAREVHRATHVILEKP